MRFLLFFSSIIPYYLSCILCSLPSSSSSFNNPQTCIPCIRVFWIIEFVNCQYSTCTLPPLLLVLLRSPSMFPLLVFAIRLCFLLTLSHPLVYTNRWKRFLFFTCFLLFTYTVSHSSIDRAFSIFVITILYQILCNLNISTFLRREPELRIWLYVQLLQYTETHNIFLDISSF